MIKLSAANPKTGRDMLVIGLSEGNLQRMREGKPVHIHGEEWGQKFDLMIFWGETEQAMVKMVEPFIGPETIMRDELTNPPKKS
jgi:hypothetical protein